MRIKKDHEHRFFNVFPGAETNMCECGIYEHKNTPMIDMPMSTKTSGKLTTLTAEQFVFLKSHKWSHIVRAVNAHEELLRALKNLLLLVDPMDSNSASLSVHFAKEAIAKAEAQ